MNRTDKYTPGPWVVQGKYDGQEMGVSIIASNHHREVSSPSRGQVAFATAILNTDARKCEANARLIAAAPDLLAALETIACQSLGDDWTAEQAIKFVKDHAREAIAKARAAKAKGEDSP